MLALIPLSVRIGAGVAAFLAVSGCILAVRSHWINQGWDSALSAVKVQDSTAKAAAGVAQRAVDACYEENGNWSVITQKCTPEVKP